LRQKVEVAPGKGIKTVIIPAGQMMIKEMNLTWNLSEYALPLGANVTEAKDIDEAVSIFTGSALKNKDKNISINNDYEKIMEFLAFDLCNRTKTIRDEISGFMLDNKTKEMNDKAVNLTKKAEESVKERKFYSAASYCFGANVQYGTIISSLSKKNADFNSSISTLNKMRENLESIPIKTMTDLETYMAVDERLSEAEESLGYAMEDYANKSDEWAYEYSYSVERAYSAESWSKFFGKPGKEFAFNEEVMKESCANKIAEAVERSQYVSLFAPEFTEIQDSIDKAQKYSAKEKYALCLHQSSKAKAEADAIISLIGVEEDYLGTLVDNKLSAVKRMIAEQQETGIFPIVGYSYYEYANSLKDEDQASALLYSEYALELSNLDMYFKEKSKSYLRFGFDSEKAIIFICGLIAGIIIGIIFRMRIKTLASTRRRLRGKKR
jgi:predicted S18 family serine protease